MDWFSWNGVSSCFIPSWRFPRHAGKKRTIGCFSHPALFTSCTGITVHHFNPQTNSGSRMLHQEPPTSSASCVHSCYFSDRNPPHVCMNSSAFTGDFVLGNYSFQRLGTSFQRGRVAVAGPVGGIRGSRNQHGLKMICFNVAGLLTIYPHVYEFFCPRQELRS